VEGRGNCGNVEQSWGGDKKGQANVSGQKKKSGKKISKEKVKREKTEDVGGETWKPEDDLRGESRKEKALG